MDRQGIAWAKGLLKAIHERYDSEESAVLRAVYCYLFAIADQAYYAYMDGDDRRAADLVGEYRKAAADYLPEGDPLAA